MSGTLLFDTSKKGIFNFKFTSVFVVVDIISMLSHGNAFALHTCHFLLNSPQ